MTDPAAPLHTVPAAIATITGDDLLKKLDRLTEAVGNVDRKIDPVISAIADLKAVLGDHETRLRTVEAYGLQDANTRLTAVERSDWKRQGATSLVSAIIASGLVGTLIELVHR